MRVRGMFLPLVTACVGVSAYPAHGGETGCAGPQSAVWPTATAAGQAAACLHLAGAACAGVWAPETLPAPQCCVSFECAAMGLRDVVWAGGSHPCSRLAPPAWNQG